MVVRETRPEFVKLIQKGVGPCCFDYRQCCPGGCDATEFMPRTWSIARGANVCRGHFRSDPEETMTPSLGWIDGAGT